MKDPYSPPGQESHIKDYSLGDLPLETLEIEEEPVQSVQFDHPTEFGEGEEWLDRALAAVRVREAVALVALGPAKKELVRQQRKKEAFLQAFKENLCNITASCLKADVGRQTYYDWMRQDVQFRVAVNELENDLPNQVEDILKELVSKKDPSSVKYMLDRTNPKYKPKAEVEHVIGNRTLEDLFYEQAAKRRADLIPAQAEVISISKPEEKDNGTNTITTTNNTTVQAE